MLFASLWILPVFVLLFALTSYNMMALYGDQTRLLSSVELDSDAIRDLRFWRNFHITAFWMSLLMIPINFILYIKLIRKPN